MKLDELLAEFDDADPEDALEMLIDYSDELPAVSSGRQSNSPPPECRIQECQTPVYLWVDLTDGRARLEAVVPEKSPTVRGFVALLVNGLSGATPDEIFGLPDDLLSRLGLMETLGMTRQRGFRGIMTRIKREVARATGRTVSHGV